MSKKGKRLSFSFSNEKFMLGCFKLFCKIERGKQYKYVINIPSTKDRLQTKRAIFEPFIFKTSHKNVS